MRNPTKLFVTTAAICAAYGECAFAQDPAAAAAVPPPPPPPKWESSASVGLTITRGNSDTTLLTGAIGTKKKWDKNEIELGGDGTYGTQNGIKNNESLHGFGQYNRLFTERFYGYGRGDALHDGIADVQYRVTLTLGPGYYFIKNERTFLRAEVGPGYVFEDVAHDSNSYATLRLAERFEHKLTKTARIWESVEVLPDISDFNNFVVNAEAGIEVAIDTRWSLKSYVLDTYDNVPAPGHLKNDFKLIAAIGYKF